MKRTEQKIGLQGWQSLPSASSTCAAVIGRVISPSTYHHCRTGSCLHYYRWHNRSCSRLWHTTLDVGLWLDIMRDDDLECAKCKVRVEDAFGTIKQKGSDVLLGIVVCIH